MRLQGLRTNVLGSLSLSGLCITAVIASLFLGSGSLGQSATQVSSGHNRYENEHYRFSFEYPKTWATSEALDGNAVSVSPSGQSRSRIAVSGRKVMSTEAHTLSLEEDFEASLRAIQKKRPHPEHHPENVFVEKKETTTFAGLPAIVSTIRFDQDGQAWVEQGLLFHSRDGETAYEISIHCHPDELSAFQPIYDKVVQTFRLIGPPM